MKMVNVGSGICLACFLTAGTSGAELAWRTRVSPATNQLRGIAFGSGQFVAVGRLNTILTSPQGREWTVRFAGTPDLYSVTAARGWFVTGGREGWLIGASRDGIDWTNGVGTAGNDTLFGFACGNGRFVGVGSGFYDNGGFILSATSSLDFDLANSARPTTNALLAVAHANDLFVAVGERGTIVTSSDGAQWTVRDSGTQDDLRAVAFHESRFIAAGTHGVVLASADGLSWSAAAPAPFDVNGLASGTEGLVAVGSFGSAGRLHVSPDGLSWPGTSLEFPQPLHAVAHGLGSFVAVGDGGLIVQSVDLANYWTNAASGFWEEPYWSLGELPSLQQPAIAVMNPGWKVLAVGASTTANYSNTLAIQNLFISAPEGSFNELLLNYAGLDVPLNIASDLALGPNASLASHYSRLNARRLLLNSPAFFADQSVATLGLMVVGDAGPGQLSIANASVQAGAVTVGGGAPGVVNQSGGSHRVDAKLSINGQSIYNLTNGSLEAGTLFIGEENRPGWVAVLCARGGSTRVSGSVRLGTSPLFAADARGQFVLLGGSLETPVIDFGNGIFTQDGGTNQVQSLNLPAQDAFGWADYQLGGGTLISEILTVGAHNPLGYFVQSGGTHRNTQSITIYGQSIPEHSVWGTYRLYRGWLSSPQLRVLGGEFTQQSGTNEAVELTIDMTTTFTLAGGLLTSSNISIRSATALNRQMLSSFVQSNGTQVIRNRLYLEDGVYRMEAGTLAVSNLHIGPDGELRLDGGSVDVSGTFDMDNGTCTVQGQNYRLGKLLVLSTGALSRFYDGPMVCSFNFQTGPTVLRFLDSHDLAAEWTGFLALKNWRGSTNGGGTDQVFVGTTAQGLAPAQLVRIGFVNPQGLPPATYPARILATGEIVPGPRPTLQVGTVPGGLVLSWTGEYRLYSSQSVLGPYFPVVNASNAFTVSFEKPQAFFQLRSR